MSFWTLIRHRLQTYWRAPFFGRRLFSLILGGIFTLYLGSLFVLFGFLFDDLVGEIAPGTDPLLIASRWLLPVGLGYTAFRTMMESGIGVKPDPYLVLPIPKKRLTNVLALLELLSAWNAIPMAFAGALCVDLLWTGGMKGEVLRFGLVCLGLLAATTYLAPMLRQGLSDRPFVSVGVVVLAAGSVGIEGVNLAFGSTSLLDISEWLIAGLVEGRMAPCLASMVGLSGVIYGYIHWLRRTMMLDHRTHNVSASEGSRNLLGRLAQCGPVWRETVLELRLVLRNTRPRFSIIGTLIVVGTVTAFGYFVDNWTEMYKLLSGTQMINTVIWQGLFGTGAFVIFYGANSFSWEGEHFEAIMARPIRSRQRADGKLLLLAASVVGTFLIPVPVVIVTGSPVWTLHSAFALYNIGVLVPATLAGATFNRKTLILNDHLWMGATNLSAGRVVITTTALMIPFSILGLTSDPVFGLIILGGIGSLSILALPLWRHGITALYNRNLHTMAQSFRASGE